MSLYAATNIAHAVRSFGKRGYASLRGLILNSKKIENEQELVKKVSDKIETPIIYCMSRDPYVQKAEALGKTVVEAFPECAMTKHYRTLAKILLEGEK